MRIATSLFALLLAGSTCKQAKAQENNSWTLQQSVSYALSHNISIKQNELNERLARLTWQQSQLSQLPYVSASTSYGRSFGRSIDPTSNQFVQGSYDFASLSGQASVLLFGWFQLRNQIAQNKLSFQAASADLEQLKDDVSLNVATGFLRALLAKEQVKVNLHQVALSEQQLNQTRRFNEAGRVPELDVAQLESQLASDSANLIGAIADYNASILDMKALLNFEFEKPFEIQAPDISHQMLNNVLNLDPEHIYNEAKNHFGSIKSNRLQLAASEKSVKATRAGLWPQLSLGAQIGSNYASTYREMTGYTITGEQPSGTYVDVSGTRYLVMQPLITPVYHNTPFEKQLSNNFRQTLSFNLNIPVFNGWQTQAAIRQARIKQLSQELNLHQAELTLKQNIYKACNDAVNSFQKYTAAKRSAEAANRAFYYAEQRYQVGMTGTVEYLSTQNNLYRAESSLLSAKYDLVFRLKVIDYYMGKELSL